MFGAKVKHCVEAGRTLRLTGAHKSNLLIEQHTVNNSMTAKSKKSPVFQLQYDATDIQKLADEYMASKEGAKDRVMEEAGRRIVAGDFSRPNLEDIYKWKAARAIRWLRKNTDIAVKMAIEGAVAAADVKQAVDALTVLRGVRVKMASAILTAINPERYTVLDFRALEALGSEDSEDLDLYVEYLEFCQNSARRYRITMRNFDRANWQWSKNKAERESKNKRLRCKQAKTPQRVL